MPDDRTLRALPHVANFIATADVKLLPLEPEWASRVVGQNCFGVDNRNRGGVA